MVLMPFVPLDCQSSIIGHLAKGNPILEPLRHKARATFWVEGASMHIPSSWGTGALSVPTTYYEWARFEVEVKLVRDPEALVSLLHRQMTRYQPEVMAPGLSLDDPGWQALLQAITGLEMSVLSWQSRHKFGQNKPAQFRRHIAAKLRERSAPEDLFAAEMIEQNLAAQEFASGGPL